MCLLGGAGLGAWSLAGGRTEQAAADEEALARLFMQVSALLTERSDLDPSLGARYADLLGKRTPQMSAGLTELARQPQSDAQRGLREAILTAWYVGQVGMGDPPPQPGSRSSKEDVRGPEPVVLAYEKALMFTTVSDVLTVPSYCRDVPGYWAERPPAAGGTQ